MILILVSGSSFADVPNRGLYSTHTQGRASVSTRDGVMEEGTPIFVTIDSERLKLRIDRLRISAYGSKTVTAGNRQQRLQLVSGPAAQWQGRLSVDGVAYRVTGTLDTLNAQRLPPAKRADSQPMRGSARRIMAEGQVKTLSEPSSANPTILDLLVIREASVDPHFIELSVLFANDAYYLSGAPVQLRIVATEEVEPVQGLLNDILDRAIAGEGEFSSLPPPAAYGADLAALFTNTMDDFDLCGLANIGLARIDGTLFADDRLYSVNKAGDPACFEDLLAHEVGHNMGALHDRDNTENDEIAAFDFAFGYNDGMFGTLMSYAPSIDPFFSNPELLRCGSGSDQPCGVPAGEENASDVALLLIIAAPFQATIGDLLEAGAITHTKTGASCRAQKPQGNNSLEWRQQGLINRSPDNIEVVCPLERIIEDGNSGTTSESLFVTLTAGTESNDNQRIECALVESVAGDTVYRFAIDQVLARDMLEAATFTFPRATPQNALLSAYAVHCSVPPGGIVHQLSTTAAY